jgi:hypothetical protein
MTNTLMAAERFDEFGRGHPRVVAAAIGILTVVVALVLLTTPRAPIVLYQAF